MEQQYPFYISVYKDSDRFLINPKLVTTGEFRSNSPWIRIIDKNDENVELLLSNVISDAIEYIKNSPILNIWETTKSIGEYIYWKQENKYKSGNAFYKRNVCFDIVFNEDKTYDIYTTQPTAKDLYYNIKQEAALIKNASPFEIGKAIIIVADMIEKSDGKYKSDKYPPVEMDLLSGKKVKIYPPRNSRFDDLDDGGAAEIYKLYEYSASEGAEPSARLFVGIAAELGCDITEGNIRTVWEKFYGKAESFEVTDTSCGIFTLRADMRNKKIRKVSYLLRICEFELLECTLEVDFPNKRKKTEEKLLNIFEGFAGKCKLEKKVPKI